MKKIFTLFGVFLVSLTLALTAADANAAKFGGKRSFGKSYRTGPAQQAKPVNTNKPAAAQPAGAKRGLLGGMMGGLLAGGLLAWLFGSGAFEGIQMMDMLILAGIAFLAFTLFRRMNQAKQGAMTRQATSPYAATAPQESPFATYQAPSAVSGSQSGFREVPFNLPDGFDLQQFLNGARDHYRTLQQAWNLNDLSKIQEYVTPELYNALVEERRLYAGEQHTEVMFVDAELVRADHTQTEAQISVRFKGRYRDTVEQLEEPIDEIWHLERKLTQADAPWFIVGIEQ